MSTHTPRTLTSPAAPESDQLRLLGIEARGRHGVFDHERRDGQRFVVDLVLGVDAAGAAARDDLAATVDYGSLATRVVSAVENDPVDLIETLAERVAGVCLSDARVAWAEVTVHKPEAPLTETVSDVAVTIRRSGAPPAAPGPMGAPEDHDLS